MASAETEADRRASVHIQATHSGASAFGDDLDADDAYSVSELSHIDDDIKARTGGVVRGGRKGSKGGKEKAIKFTGKPKLSAMDRKDSVLPENLPEVSEIPDPGLGPIDTISSSQSKRKGSSGSGEKSDEVSTPSSPASGDSEEDMSITTFASFAQTRFQMKIPHTYSCSALPQPLLPKRDKADHMAAMSSWVTMLRIMGDLPDFDVGDTLLVAGTASPIVSRIRSGFQAKYTKKDAEEFQKKYTDLFKDPTGTDLKSLPFMSLATDTMLDKIQMLCALGIYKPSLRDELYCQLCKQLTCNPSRNSSARGWVLLSLMVSSFAPSERFISCLTTFLQEGPIEFADKIDIRLRRTCSAGTRGYPPSWLEFQAAKNGKPLLIPITCMNGLRMLYEMDGATTVAEVVTGLCQRLNILDSTGFSIYIALQTRTSNRISCLGNGQHRILDAVSECEQYSKSMGISENKSTWRIFLRKEFFPPWQLTESDAGSTDLVYRQISKGITMGEFPFEKEDQLMTLASMVFSIEFPKDESCQKLGAFLSDFIPENIVERKPENYYYEKIKNQIENNRPGRTLDDEDIIDLKKQVVAYVRDGFYTLFSRYYDATRVTGFGQQLPEMVIGVNHKGLYVVDTNDKVRFHVHFCEIVEVSTARMHVVLRLVGQDEVVITMQHVDDFYDLMTSFLQGLKQVSTWAIALKDFTQLDEKSEEAIRKGDLLVMGEALGQGFNGTDNIRVVCPRTAFTAEVPINMINVLSTAEKPKKEILDKIVQHLLKETATPPIKSPGPYTLQSYAKSKFRPDTESSVTKFFQKASFKRNKPQNDLLWQYTKDPLKKPLLKKTCSREDVRKLALVTFASIQSYMTGNNPPLEEYCLCLEFILDPARRNKYTRDEVYCQVVKQLTNNPDRSNEDRGWILLALLTSSTLPNHDLLEHVCSFIRSSTHPLAARCTENINLQAKEGAYRLYSAHFLEHSMVAKQQPNIRVPIYFPNQSSQTIEVTSQTKIFQIKKVVGERLKLKSVAEYSVFLTNNEKGELRCLSDRAFFFDCLSHADAHWFKVRRRQSGTRTSPSPMLVMLKKIWTNSKPGNDPVADNVFHFPQEVTNYLRGYHPIVESDQVVPIAAFMYRSLYGDDASKFNKFDEVCPQIFPQRFMAEQNAKEIEVNVIASYNANKGMSVEKAKEKFLEKLSGLPTYGSVFFEGKQRHVKSLPPMCLIGINFSGVHIVDKLAKTTVKSYEFHSCPNWAFDEASFTFIFNQGGDTSKLLVETKVGHNIDDLLMSYIAWIMNYEMRKKFGFVGEFSGESIC